MLRTTGIYYEIINTKSLFKRIQNPKSGAHINKKPPFIRAVLLTHHSSLITHYSSLSLRYNLNQRSLLYLVSKAHTIQNS
jgi:hypothetical protein